MKSNFKKSDRIKDASKFAIKFANTVLVLGILFSFLVAVYAVYKIYIIPVYITPTFYYLCIFLTVFTATFFGFGLSRLPDELKVNLSVIFIAAGITIYSFEIYLEFFHKGPQSRIPKEMGALYDARTTKELFKDLRDSGVNAYPNVVPSGSWLIKLNGFSTNSGKIYPLGGISNITTVYWKENGYFPIIELDEHGFNNPKGLYTKNNVDIVLTGDSFTEGYSVQSDETISAVLRKSGFSVISLGKGGNGPFIEIAALKEYAEPLNPKIVLWMYHVSDLNDFSKEMQSSILKRYLNEDDYSQNLISRQEEIDSVLVDYVEGELERERGTENNDLYYTWNKLHWIIRISKLNNLRERINLRPTNISVPIFKDILQKSKQMVSEWGGKMYFVYLPSYHHISGSFKVINREFVLNTATQLDIPIIDIHREVFDPHPDPLSLFPFRMDAHYNADGYRLVAEAILNRLNADGIIPLNSRN